MPRQRCAEKKGFATLLAILAIFAIGTTVAVFSLSLAIGSSRLALDLSKSKKSQALADQCAELAVQKIKNSPGFTGTENFSYEWGECEYTVTSEIVSGTINWQIDSSGLSGGAVRKVRLTLSATIPPEPDLPVPILDSWREVASFD
jgi:hypothetical protein